MHHFNLASTIWRDGSRSRPGIKKRSTASLQIYRFAGGIAVDTLVFEFMGLAMVGLCVVVLAVPSRRPPARHISDS
jgi:hypothetical protein